MALVELDRRLIERLLARESEAWQQFVDRFIGVIIHTIRHTAHQRSQQLDASEVEDLSAEFFKLLCENDFQILRRFRGQSSLTTYLVVIARRHAVHFLAKRAVAMYRHRNKPLEDILAVSRRPVDLEVENADEIRHLLDRLKGRDADLVRGLFLEHKSYRQLSEELQMPINSIGPTAKRILRRLRRASA
jgi:RNA polymerase sigma-70 factor (ECF subfamily)